MNNTMIEVKKLEKSPLNVRKTAAGIDDLLASIPKHGLMLNLNVYPGKKGKYFVFAGSRRLAALKALQAEGHFAADYAVPCRIYTKEEAHELSLVENTVRQAMHPADEFTAFAALIEQGHTVEQVSNRFGCTAKLVEQRLTLGKAAPELLDAYRAEKLTLECLMAFTVTDDHAKQMQVYASLEEWHSARDIRAMLTDEMAEAKSKLARFVGLDAYHAAGGVSRADLFGEQVYLENPDLLHQLAGEALETTRQTLAAEGWKWVEVSPDRDWSVIHGCSRIRPQPVDAPPELLAAKAEAEAELEAITEADGMDGDDSALAERQEAAETALADIEQKLESFVAYDPDEMSQAGCYVSIDKDGKLSVEKGLVRREDAKQLAGDGDARRAKPGGMPATLQRNLEGYRLQAAQVEIARNRLVALDLLVFTVACAVFNKGQPRDLDVLFRTQNPAVKEPTAAGEALQTIEEGLSLGWLHQDTEAEQFQAFTGLSDQQKLDLLAYCVASSLKPQLSTGREATACELALSLTAASMAGYWRPTRANYLGRIPRDQLLSLGSGLLGDQWSQARSRDKRSELADALERVFAEPEKVARSPQQLEMLQRWLPEGMAFGSVEEAPAPANEQVAA